MSKLYDKYLFLRKNNPNTNILYLFKSGIFFIFLDSDAIIASDILGLKLTNLTESIVKCGFPSSSLEKYSKLLNHCGYSVKVIENSTIYSLNDFKINSETIDLLKSISHINTAIRARVWASTVSLTDLCRRTTGW